MPVPSVYTTSFPTGGSRSGGGSSTPPWYTDPWLWANLAGTAGDVWASTSSASQANKTNVKLQREQRDWQEKMSNTEIQRRKADLIAAGGNPALAFTSGSGASSPSVAPPHVEPTYRGGQGNNIGTAAIAAAQLRNLNASTDLTSQKGRQEKVVADAMTRTGPGGTGTMASWAYDTKNLHEALKYDTDQIRKDLTAAQLKQFNEATDAVVETIKTQAARQKIDLDQIRSVIESFGLGAETKTSLIKSVMQILMQLMGPQK